MRKKFLLMLIVLVIALGGGGNLFAQNVANDPVAKVGNTEYATIDEAIAAWTNGTTLTLLADVTLSDVIKLSSTEYHILDLGTYTMTAAKNKDAIQYVVNGRNSASYALDIKADANDPGGITASGSVVKHSKPWLNAPDKDRPITRFYGGVFNAKYVVNQSTYNGSKAPHFYFYGGEFNGIIYTNRSSVQFHGGVFNGTIQMSVDSSSWAMVAGGKFKNLSNIQGSNLDEKIAQGKDHYKFTIGSAKMTYDRGIYVDKDGYYVITSAPITEVSAEYPAVYKTTYGGDDYFYYSAAATYGLFYEDVDMAIKKHGEANVTVWVKPAVTIPETLTGTVVDEIKNNTALNGYTPENLPTGAELEIELKSVGDKCVYDVTPMANGVEVEPTEAITFRLPVPASVDKAYAKVYHEGTPIGIYEIKGEGNAKYVEIASADFSEFAVEPIIHYEVATYEALINALANDGAFVIMTANITATATQSSGYGKAGIVLDAGDVLDGNDKTLTIYGAGATWDCAIAMRGGEVKNLTISGAFRGIFMPGANGDVVVDNCVFEGVIYTFNSDAGSKEYTVTIKNTILNGWTSFSNVHEAVVFESCEFGKGNGYAFCRPYQATTFNNCEFNEGYEFDTKSTTEDLSFNDCTYNEQPLSAENNAMFYNGGSVVIDGTHTDVNHYVATIDANKYLTLEEAFAAAAEGQTITLLADATPALKSQRAITKAAVIDLGGKTMTLTEDDLYFGTTTFKSGTIVVDPSVKPSTAVFWMFANQTLTFDAVKVVATGVTGTYLIGLDGNNSDLNLINGSEILVENTTALDLDIICVNASTGNDIKVENSKVNVTNLDGRVFFRGNYTVSGNSKVNLEGITKAGFRIEAGQTLTIADNAIVNIVGEPRDGGIHLTDLTATYTKEGTATVNATVNEVKAVAQIGTTKYASIQKAVEAAVLMSGDVTIEVMAGTYAENINLTNTAVTVGDANARPNITFKPAAGADVTLAGTTTLGYRIQNVGASMWQGEVIFEGIKFNHAENGNHSLDIQDVKGITLLNCTITGDGEYGIGSNGSNATPKAAFTNCIFENGAMQVLGQLSANLVIDGCTFDEFSVNAQGGAKPGLTIKNSTFNLTLTDAHVGESFYAVRSNANPINIQNTKVTVDSELSSVAADQAKWGLFWARKDGKDVQWNVASCEVNLTDAAMAQTELPLTKNDGTANAFQRIILTDLTSTSNNVADLIKRTEGCATVNGINYKDGERDFTGLVAKIGDEYYATISDAVAAVEDGGTITLIANETFTKNNRYNNGGWWDGLGYSGDKSFTIDLANFTISQDGALNDYLMWFKNDGAKGNTITLKNGTLDAGTTAYSALATSSSNAQKITVNLENINVINNKSDGAALKIRGGSELNVKAGTIITGQNSYLGIEAVGKTTVVNIYEGAEIYQNGTSSYCGCLAGASGNSTINVYGGKGQSKSGGFIAMTSGGTINIEGGEWTANTDGTYANGNKSVLVAQSDKQYNAGAGNSIVNVTGGTFKGGYNCYGNAVGDAQINIKGGNFNAKPTSYVAEDYIAVENNGVWNVVKAAAKIGEQKYATLEAAFKAATSGCTIDIINNVTVDYAWDARKTGGKFTVPVTINGNGKTIKFTASVNDQNYQAPFRFEADATVKNLTIDMSEVTDNRFRAISSKGNLTVDGCKFIGKDESLNCRAIIFGEGAGANVGNLAIAITNSEFNNWKRGITDNENAQDVKTVTITGNKLTDAGVGVSAKETVTFTGNTVAGAYVNIKSYTAGNKLAVTATGNTLEANTDAAYNVIDAGGVVNAEGFKVVAKGNNFNGYVGADGIWGEVWGNARESFVIKVLDAEGNVMGSTSLNNIGGIINGNVNVTWNLKFNAVANTDEYWTMEWTTAPTINNMPAKVELWVDGVKVSGGNVVLNGPDDLNKIVTIVTDADGKVLSCHTTLANAVAAAQAGETVAILKAGTYALKVKNNVTITGAVAGVEFANIGAFGCNGANVTFNNVTFTYANNSTYKGLQHSGNLVYNNCTFNGQVFLYGENETFNKCIFNTNDSNNYNVWTYAAKNVAFNECTFNSAGKSVLIYAESASVTNNVSVAKCQFIASQPVEGKAAIEMDSSLTDGINLTIDENTTASGFGNGNVSGNSLWNNKKGNADAANNDITVKVGDDVVLAPIYEAQIGETKYRKLADAFAAAKAGDVVKVFAGTYAMPSMKAGITIIGEGDVLFEGTLSGTLENLTMKNIHIKGGNAQRWAYAKGDYLVFENVTFEATGVYALHFDGIAASTSLTYKNCTIIGWAALGGTPASCTFEGCTIKGNGTYGLIRTYFNTTIKDCTFDVAKVNTTDAYQDGIHAVEGAQVVVENCTNANGDMKDLVNVHANSVVTVDGVAIKNLAKVGNNYYLTLQDAFAAVGGGAVVIELLDNATLNYGAREAYGTAETTSLTINGNGKVLTLNQTNSDWSSFGLANAEAKVVFNNMTIEKTGHGDTNGAWNTHAIIFSSNVEMQDVVVNNSMAVQDGAILNNVAINEANGYYGLWINGNGQSVTMNGGSITATNGGRGIKIADQYIDNPAQVTLNVTGTVFKTAKKAAVLVSSKAGAKIAASNVNIENVAADKVNFVWVDEDWAANYGNVEVTGAEVAQEGIENFVAEVKKDDKVQAYYKDLHAAMVAAKAGETVVLIADVDLAGTEWEPVSFGGTFDGKGKIISNLTINKPGVSNTGFIKSLNGTVKNVTFTNPTVTGGENTAVVAGRAGGSAALAENITINGTIKVETTHSGYARAAAIVGGWAYGNYKNITVDGVDKANSYIKHTGGGDGRYVAGIVGHADDVNSYVNCTVKNITISGGWLCGGIAGPGPADKLASDCSVENIDINADYSGGMFGWYYGAGTIENATIKNVTFTDGSTNNGVVGGYGHNTDATVTNLTFENVQNSDGKPLLDHVASIDNKHYFTLADAVNAADNNATISLIWKEGKAPIAMNASLYGKNVTISGTATVDWSKGFLFVGRGGEGNATLTFDGANLTSASNNASTGIHVSGREKGTNNKYDGTVVIKNSTIVLDYLINKGEMTLDNATLTVKNGFAIGGRPAKETESGNDATATIALTNGSKVVVNNHNGMGLGYEAIGIMNVDATSTFETTQSFLVTAKGTMNIAGTAKVAGTLTNYGAISFKSDAAVLETTNAELTIEIGYDISQDKKVAYRDGAYKVVDKDYVAQVGTQKFETLQEAIIAVEEGKTVTLIDNVTFTEATRTHNSGTWYDGLYYIGDKSFTIDLGGFTIGQDGSVNDYLLNFKNVGSKANTIILKNGTVDAGTAAFCALCTSSSQENQLTINTENLALINNISNGSTVKLRGGAILNVKEGTVITGKNSYLGIECVASTVNIYDGAEIYMNGTSSYNGCLVGACSNGTVNVYGGYGKGVKGGFIAMTSGGTINISGGEWIANTDGAIGNNSNVYVLTAQNNKYESGYKGASIINVTGGTFRGGMDAWILNDVNTEKAELNISGGNYNADPSAYVIEKFLAVQQGTNLWVVKQVSGTLTRTLPEGWSWFSSYVKIAGAQGLTTLESALGTSGIQIKDLAGRKFAQYSTTSGWYGLLKEASSEKMYSINTSAAVEVRLDGEFYGVIDGNFYGVEYYKPVLSTGWNFLSYPHNDTLDLATALSKFAPVEGDIIKSKSTSAIYLDGSWYNAFDLVPGEGYMYRSQAGNNKPVSFTTEVTRAAVKSFVSETPEYWTVDATQYPGNMTMIATLDVEGGDYEVAAFVNGELRGSARPIFNNVLDQYIVIMTINGDEAANVTFKYYDFNAGEEYDFNNVAVYSDNAVLGSTEEPYALTRGTTGIGEATLSDINIYPNPTTTDREINLQATCDKVEVFNALGVKVVEYQNVDTIDALETAGTYVIRVTLNGDVKHCRLVVK